MKKMVKKMSCRGGEDGVRWDDDLGDKGDEYIMIMVRLGLVS